MKKILFLEDKCYYSNFGLDNIFSIYTCEFNGIKKYKISTKKLKEYSAVISFLYNNPICNFIIKKAKRNNIRTILLSDGIYEYSNAYKNIELKKYNLNLFDPILHDVFLCVGKREKRFFENKFLLVYQYLPKRILDIEQQKLSIKKNEKILITTANTAYFDEIEKKSLISLLKEVIQILDELGIEYIFRIFDQTLIENLKITPEKNFNTGLFDEVLIEVSSIITTPSSIVLNAMYHQKKVAQLIYKDTPLILQSGWIISKSFPIKESIKSLVKGDQNRINFQNNILKEYIPNENLDKVLTKIIEDSYLKKINCFIQTNEENMLNSVFNLNFEFFIRKIYLKIKNNKYVKKLKKRIK